MRRQNCTVECPKSMVGRVIGRNGETIKALQNYTGALVQIDQTADPCRVTISGTPQSLALCTNMVTDIVRGTFKGFALLRQCALSAPPGQYPGVGQQGRPIYAPGYGLLPASQLYGTEVAPPMMMASAPYAAGGRVPQASYQFVQATQGAPSQLMLQQSLQPVQMGGGMGLPGPAVYNIGGTAYSGPIFYSAQDYAAATGGLGEPGMFYHQQHDTSLLGNGSGAKLLHAANAKAHGAPASRVVGKMAAADADALMLNSAANGSAAAAAAAVAASAPVPAAANGTSMPVVAGSLVMDADGQLYTYNMDA